MSLISDYDVVVIGAGAAGLAASAELMAKGKSVICLEAMDRIGGRCYTDHSIFGLPCIFINNLPYSFPLIIGAAIGFLNSIVEFINWI